MPARKGACRTVVSAFVTAPQRKASRNAPKVAGSSNRPRARSGSVAESRILRPASNSHSTRSSSPRPSSSTLDNVTRVCPSPTVLDLISNGSVVGATSVTTQCRPRTLANCPSTGNLAEPNVVLRSATRFPVVTAARCNLRRHHVWPNLTRSKKLLQAGDKPHHLLHCQTEALRRSVESADRVHPLQRLSGR